MPREETLPEWLKDIDLSRTAENILLGATLFVGRYAKTVWCCAVSPRKILAELILNPELKPVDRPSYVRPLSFLATSGFLYLLAGRDSFGVPVLIQPVIDRLDWWIEQIPNTAEDLTFENIASFMFPLVVFVALYAYVSALVFAAVLKEGQFKIHLNIHCYIAGMFAAAIVAASLIEGSIWDFALDHETELAGTVALYAYIVVVFLLFALILARHLQFLRAATKGRWWRVAAAAVISFGAYWVICYPMLLAIEPIAERLASGS